MLAREKPKEWEREGEAEASVVIKRQEESKDGVGKSAK
jgi:hypothetical protein